MSAPEPKVWASCYPLPNVKVFSTQSIGTASKADRIKETTNLYFLQPVAKLFKVLNSGSLSDSEYNGLSNCRRGPWLMATTLDDVAKLAGVSRSAVSRTFTDGAAVSLKMRRKVEKAASELGYSPNFLARSLTTRRT